MSTKHTPESLQLLYDDALAALEDNEQWIKALRARIAELEFHLRKFVDHCWTGISATRGVLPLVPEDEPKPKAAKTRAAKASRSAA